MSIMVVDAVGEECIFGIVYELLTFGIILVVTVPFDDGFQGFSDGQVMSVLLIPEDIPAVESGLNEVVNQFFLGEVEFFESGYLIVEDLFVAKVFSVPVETIHDSVFIRDSGII